MDAFFMSLNSLEHGWATITLTGNERSEEFMISYIFYDSLSDIVDSAICLSRGQNSEVMFNLEPEEVTCWIEAQEDGTFVRD